MPFIALPLQTLVAGDTWPFVGNITDATGAALDPTLASSVTWKLDDPLTTKNYLTLTLGNGITIGTVAGWPVPSVIITATYLQTANIAPGVYQHSLQMVLGGVYSTVWMGRIQVVQAL